MAAKKVAKRLGKKHRQASTRPKKGRAPKAGATGAQMAGGLTGKLAAAAPKKRKAIGNQEREAAAKKLVSRRSPEFESKRTIVPGQEPRRRAKATSETADGTRRPARGTGRGLAGESTENAELRANAADEAALEKQAWKEAERTARRQAAATETEAVDTTLPLIAICGRPNVGKSTLFNRLTGTRRSIVGDEPGITRDRIYGEIEWDNRRVRLVDTGGVVPDDEALIPSEIFRQARVALEEADAIVMVVDGRSELAAPDLELARLLLRGGKPSFLAVNKMEAESLHAGAENFRTLGFRNVLPVSAEHGTGVGDLLDEVFAVLPPVHEPAEPDADEALGEPETEAETGESPEKGPKLGRTHGEFDQRETKVAIIGRPNVGKSTLLNALTGTERAIVSPIAGTTRDAVDEVVEREGHSFRFVDTAGIRKKGKTKLMAEKLSVVMARKHLEAADVALLVIDAAEGVTAIDATIGGYAHESGRSVVIVINKWDLVTTARTDGKAPADKKVYEQQVRDALKYLEYAPLLFCSAEEGKGLEPLFKKVELVARERRKRVSTGQMNRFLDRVDFQKASVPMNRRMRIYYMTQAQVAPPTFVLFTDRDVDLHFSYERFLANQIRDSFGFIGSPIWFKVRARNKKKSEE